MFAEKELKLARLALNSQAPEGEWQNAAVKFFLMLRAEGRNGLDEFEGVGNNGQMVPIPATKPDWGLTIFPFGKKHKGELFKDIPPGYLAYQRQWIYSEPDILKRWQNVADAIDAFLAQ